ncbi:MAG: molybdenum ABC transporter ATP-binding protein [Gammaproteobacteria bacterium]|nr:molybdenum ABC transporter ATP-binding protein [Gammaproteobacteria bacterium]
MSQLQLRHTLQQDSFSLSVDVSIPATGVTGVFGESGSGKTTLLRCVAGLESSESPDDRAIHERRIGYVFQEPQLFEHLTVRKNIEYGLKRCAAATSAPDEIIQLLDIEALMHRMPASLSGGEAQRVSIARVLCQSPQLILMDEPLSALDQRRKDDVLPYLDRLRAELSIPMLYVSHSIDEICRLCDHLLILQAGRIVAEGELHTVLGRLDLPQLGGANSGVALDAKRVRYDAEFDLSTVAISGGELFLPGDVGRDTIRLRIRASDVSLTRELPSASSILNILPAKIVEIVPESVATALVKVSVRQDSLISRVTNRSVRQLNLAVGDELFAQVKSATVRY